MKSLFDSSAIFRAVKENKQTAVTSAEGRGESERLDSMLTWIQRMMVSFSEDPKQICKTSSLTKIGFGKRAGNGN